jgi:hypothetical protein
VTLRCPLDGLELAEPVAEALDLSPEGLQLGGGHPYRIVFEVSRPVTEAHRILARDAHE